MQGPCAHRKVWDPTACEGQLALPEVKEHERNKQDRSEITKQNEKERIAHTHHRPKMVAGGWSEGPDVENLRPWCSE